MSEPIELCGGKVVHRKIKTAKKARRGLRDGKEGKLSLYPCIDPDGIQRFGAHFHLGNLVGRKPRTPQYKRKGRRVVKVPRK